MKRKMLGLAFILLSITIVSVTAWIYESATQTLSGQIRDVATLTLKNSALGDLYEGETRSYTKADVAELGNAISITTFYTDVYLHLNSDIDGLGAYYSTYTLTVKFITVPVGSIHAVGDTAATLTIGSPDPAAITLDLAGSWAFDFELTTTAGSVSSDQATTATIIVSTEST